MGLGQTAVHRAEDGEDIVGEQAIDRRKTLMSGQAGEFLAMNFLDTYDIAYLAIEQSQHTWSRVLATGKHKRPDLIIWNRLGVRRLVEVKNYVVHDKSASVTIDHHDVRSLQMHSRDLGMDGLFAISLENRFLSFVRPANLIAPGSIGQSYTIAVEQGPETLPQVFRPRWIIPVAIVAWDAKAGKAIGLNKACDPADLFR